MAEILGYDCNGKALQAGDEAVVVSTTCSRYTYLIGETVKILSRSQDHPGCVAINRRDFSRGGGRLVGEPECLRKVEPEEPGDWSEIERVTGWQPREAENA